VVSVPDGGGVKAVVGDGDKEQLSATLRAQAMSSKRARFVTGSLPPRDFDCGEPMNAIKKVRRYLLNNPDQASARVLRRLVVTLGEEGQFPLADLYAMDLEAFDLALELMRDWRLDRYYAARIKLFDVALEGLPESEQASGA
jgi:hypothetical protein